MPTQKEFDEALDKFKEAYEKFYGVPVGSSEGTPSEMRDRREQFDVARNDLYELIEKQCDGGKILVVLREGVRETIADPNWFTNGTFIYGKNSENRSAGADLKRAIRIEPIENNE